MRAPGKLEKPRNYFIFTENAWKLGNGKIDSLTRKLFDSYFFLINIVEKSVLF